MNEVLWMVLNGLGIKNTKTESNQNHHEIFLENNILKVKINDVGE
jgi:hypothetical protein